MADFLKFIPSIITDEGFRSKDKKDSGGLTIWGLTKVADPKWEGWDLVTQCILKNPVYPYDLDLVKEQLWQMAIPYYKKVYWDPIRADEIESQILADKYCDIGVVQGIPTAIHNMQDVFGVERSSKVTDELLIKLNEQL